MCLEIVLTFTVWLFSSRILLWLAFSSLFQQIQLTSYWNNFRSVLNPCLSMSVQMHIWVWKKLLIFRCVSKSYQTYVAWMKGILCLKKEKSSNWYKNKITLPGIMYLTWYKSVLGVWRQFLISIALQEVLGGMSSCCLLFSDTWHRSLFRLEPSCEQEGNSCLLINSKLV